MLAKHRQICPGFRSYVNSYYQTVLLVVPFGIYLPAITTSYEKLFFRWEKHKFSISGKSFTKFTKDVTKEAFFKDCRVWTLAICIFSCLCIGPSGQAKLVQFQSASCIISTFSYSDPLFTMAAPLFDFLNSNTFTKNKNNNKVNASKIGPIIFYIPVCRLQISDLSDF